MLYKPPWAYSILFIFIVMPVNVTMIFLKQLTKYDFNQNIFSAAIFMTRVWVDAHEQNRKIKDKPVCL